MAEKYYVTTPIYYATDRPHIGHTYTTVVADIVARYRRLTGYDVFFLTGTDEHGQKMERQAQKRGISPAELAAETSPRYAELWQKLGIQHDGFIRTTEERHHRGVAEIWARMVAKGDIYRGDYEGLYCVSCELFYVEKELKDGNCPDHGTPAERVTESGYFFRLSAYQEPLLAYYAEHPEFIHPESRRNEVESFVRSGLRDLSISRATTRWGWSVPGDDQHVIYVWVDALTNYLTGIGWPDDASGWADWWPADVHLVGKDILRFHAIFWPAFLMSAGLPLPRQVVAHGHWLRNQEKISKSSGGIMVEPLIEQFGSDAVRYLLLREMSFGQDSSYSDQAFVARYNADLANDLGNLVQRGLHMIKRYRDGVVPAGPGGAPEALRVLAKDAVAGFRASFDGFAFARGLDSLWELVRFGNRFIDERAPWALAKDASKAGELDAVLYSVAELIRLVVTALYPVMPDRSAAVRGYLQLDAAPTESELAFGLLAAGTRLGDFAPMFPRVDEKQWLSIKESEMNDENKAAATAPETAPAAAVAAPAIAIAAPAPAAAGPAMVTFDDVMKLDLRTALVTAAEKIEKSKKLLRLQLDVGGEPRQIVAGIAEKYAAEDLVGKTIIIVANLAPAKLMGVASHGMLLAPTAPGGPVVAGFAEEVPPGSRVR